MSKKRKITIEELKENAKNFNLNVAPRFTRGFTLRTKLEKLAEHPHVKQVKIGGKTMFRYCGTIEGAFQERDITPYLDNKLVECYASEETQETYIIIVKDMPRGKHTNDKEYNAYVEKRTIAELKAQRKAEKLKAQANNQ